MRKTKKPDYLTPIPNNPRDNELYIDKKERRDEMKFNKEWMLFDGTGMQGKTSAAEIYGYRQTASRDWRERDEPDEAEQLRQAARIHKMLQQRKVAATGRENLKAKNKVPIRASTGKKLFEAFYKQATKKNHNQRTKDETDLMNIYNAAQHLSYEKWSWFVNEDYGTDIKTLLC